MNIRQLSLDKIRKRALNKYESIKTQKLISFGNLRDRPVLNLPLLFLTPRIIIGWDIMAARTTHTVHEHALDPSLPGTRTDHVLTTPS